MSSPALSIKQLEKTYPNGHEALKGISLTVEAGDFYALLGPNGAGKSTTIGIISSLINRSSGSISIFGHDLDKERVLAKTKIGLVPQEFNFSIFEPVEQIVTSQGGYYGLTRREAKLRTAELLEQLGLTDKAKVPARMLSGGMKRRLMIARALIHRPELLILDEPTAGVDIEIRRSMWAFLTELNESGVTIILTTHYLEEAESLCRNIGIIEQGELIENTDMKSLLSRLEQEHYVIDLNQAQGALSEIPSACEIKLRPDRQTLDVSFNKADFSLNELFQYFQEQNLKVDSMRNKSNRLEQLFMDLVEQANA